MTADINLAGHDFNQAVIAPNNSSNFTGIFDGAGHKVDNLKIIGDPNHPVLNSLGLFGEIGLEGEVNNLVLENVYVAGSQVSAGLAGGNAGKIINCSSDGTIVRNAVMSAIGGLVGSNGGNVIDCHSGGLITADIKDPYCYQAWTGVGGLIGISSQGNITNCYSTANISNIVATCTAEGTGGLVGLGGDSIISNCFSTGSVYGYDYVGGLLGLYGNLKNCYSTGDVNGHNGVGGLAGNNVAIKKSFSTGNVNGNSGVGGLVGDGGDVENSYSIGNVSGNSYVGGLAGSFSSATNCYSIGIVNGVSYVGGLIGSGLATNSYFLNTSGPDNGIGTPLTDDQLRHCINFNNWDFAFDWPGNCDLGPEYIWIIFDGETYPDLAWHQGLCTVPNVIGMYMSDANDKIIDRGFTVDVISYDHNDSVSWGHILSQNPEPNDQTNCGSSVSYVVSLGPWPCQIPNIVGKTMTDANNTIIYNYGQTVGKISYEYSDTVAFKHVISQNPPPGPSECGVAVNYVASLGQLCNGKFPDYNQNGIVNFADYATLANAWLTQNSLIDLTGDNFVNINDLGCFCNRWLKTTP